MSGSNEIRNLVPVARASFSSVAVEGLPFRDEADVWEKSVEWVGSWPVGDPRANPEVGISGGPRSIKASTSLLHPSGRALPHR